MVALQRTIQMVKKGKDGLINVFNDSRSALEILTGPKTYHPLAHETRRDISEIVTEDRAVRLFWVRAHAEIKGNERTDVLAKRTAFTKNMATDYGKFPLPYAKKVIRAASLEKWQERYAERDTGEITKCFFFRVEQAYIVLPQIDVMSQMVQVLTGHGEFAQYLFKFRLRDSPYCACDPTKIRNILLILEDCDMFHRERVALESEINLRVARQHFLEIMESATIKNKIPKIL